MNYMRLSSKPSGMGEKRTPFLAFNFLAILCAFGFSNALMAQTCDTTIDFNSPVLTADDPAADTWYIDRYAPGDFEANTPFDGGNRLGLLIVDGDGYSNRPQEFCTSFYDVQGRRLDLPLNTQSVEIDVYTASAWQGENRDLASLGVTWSDGLGLSHEVMLTFTTASGNAGLLISVDGVQTAAAVDAGFTYDQWHRLGFEVDANGNLNYFFGAASGTVAGVPVDEDATFESIALNGHNTTAGTTYYVFWDDLLIAQSPDGCNDPTACNYSPAATCSGDCDYDSCVGCTDATASNYNPLALTDDGSCIPYPSEYAGLSYELVGLNTVPGFNTYRVFLELNDPDAEVVAMYGVVDANANAPLEVSTSGSFYQNSNGGIISSEISPAFYSLDPLLEFDSYLTIGAEPGNSTVSVVGMEDADFDASGLLIDNVVGAVVFVVPGTEPAAIAGPDQQVLVGQFTVDNSASLLMNFQLNNGAGDVVQIEGARLDFPSDLLGCTDPAACNYDPVAQTDDGNCDYATCVGCTYANAANFNPNALTDDGSCEFEGCTDDQALNFSALATVDDGSCIVAVPGCMTPGADNYNPNANVENGSCAYGGCTDPQALNYNALANTDDGSCIAVVSGCMTPIADNYNPNANVEDGTCTFDCGPGGNDTCPADITNDGTVNVSDLLAFLSAFGNDCP